MKLKLLRIAIVITVCLLPSLCFSQQPNPKIWKPLEYNSYYNVKIINTAADTKLVWIYKTVANDVRKKRMLEIKKYDPERAARYGQYHHEVILWEIDCKRKIWRPKDIIDFDNYEIVLDRYRYNDSEWDSVAPNSIGELLYQNICPAQKSLGQKKHKQKKKKR